MTTKWIISARVKWAMAIILALVHPVLLYWLVPFLGTTANIIVFIAPVAATLLLGWRIGLVFIPVNVVSSALVFRLAFQMDGTHGRPKAVLSAIVIAVICFGVDKLWQYIAQRRQLAEELTQVRKMEAIGRLAGGVAHDMNNTLNAIMASVYAHRQELAEYSRTFKDLDNIEAACERGAQLTQNLLGFARKNKLQHQIFSLNRVLNSTELLLRRTISKNIQIVCIPVVSEPYMEGDRSQIENAVMNLCLNALDAMGDSGTLRLTTGRDRTSVFICVSDTGMGMDRAIQERLFEPFFTTKEEGKGTGLGLSMVYGAVHAMKGKILVESTPGVGTDITLRFPAQPAPNEEESAEGSGTSAANGMEIFSGRTVLIIDDEPLVLRAGERMLKSLGATVLSATSGKKGAALLEDNVDNVSLAIVDIIMPGLDGLGTLELLQQISPHLSVVLVSGYIKDSIKLDSLHSQKERVRFLSKPYHPEQMGRLARELLSEKR